MMLEFHLKKMLAESAQLETGADGKEIDKSAGHE